MWVFIAILSLLASYAGCVGLALAVRRRSIAAAASIGAAVLVCATALVLHLLSLLDAVGRAGLVAGCAAIAIAGIGALRRIWIRPFRRPPPGVATALVAALGALALASGILYRPNNWDSMTYHLGRVAHWLQNGSVEGFPTNISRQVTLTPGAEYLLLVLQGISGSDRLAFVVQFGAWLLLAAVAPALARTFGAPRRLARWSPVLVAAAPMAVLQASSTQNDLVASIMTIAIVFASLPFLHRRRRWRGPDLLLLLVAVTAAVLVKPTSAIVVAPLLVWCAVLQARILDLRAARRAMAWALPGLALAAAVLVTPYMAGRSHPEGRAGIAPFLYAGLEDPADRLTNAARGMLRNVPVRLAAADRLAPPATVGCAIPNSLCLEYNRRYHEDLVGNVAAGLVLLAVALVALIRWRRIPARGRLAAVGLLAGWFLFHGLFRDNVWITRLQLPLFAMLPTGLAVVPRRWVSGRIGGAVLAVAVFATFLHGAIAAKTNLRRPVQPVALAAGQSPGAYYIGGPAGVAERHANALALVQWAGCRRLGLFVGADSYDYPLTWRAMQSGIEVRHVVGPDDWPCVVFTDDRGPPPPRRSGERWRPVMFAPYLFVP